MHLLILYSAKDQLALAANVRKALQVSTDGQA